VETIYGAALNKGVTTQTRLMVHPRGLNSGKIKPTISTIGASGFSVGNPGHGVAG